MLQKFKMPVRNSCSNCGKIILQGDYVHANSMDEVIAGGGICVVCAKPKKDKAKAKDEAPVIDETMLAVEPPVEPEVEE